MNYKLITHNEEGLELELPTTRDFKVGDEVVYRRVTKPFTDTIEIDLTLSSSNILGFDGCWTLESGDYYDLHLYPILRPLEELHEVPFETEMEQATKYRHLDSWESLRLSRPPISEWRKLRDAGFCTNDFRLPDEVQHAIETK